ncbi:hypothetical protein AK830_g5545 [Neonectria ditissima]|uniref:Uncharacterized protein n=1 Tax=Neonectria ditissima TaxID=78410 RepID=A0A0P7BKZ6_9HYPO|nr:hypothetical protein AK830_g5545 [Neonectria ditissima]
MPGNSPKSQGGSPRQASSPKQRSISPKTATPPPQDHVIEAEENVPEDADADSALGAEGESSTASITSSILQYRTINGRTFHSDRGNAVYWGSNDEAQSEAMDIARVGQRN